MRSASEIPFLVKVCGITDEQDGMEAVKAGANALGFNFYPRSPRFVTLERANLLAKAITGKYLRVGVFVNPSRSELLETLAAVQLDVVQLHGDACASPPLHTRIWRSVALPAESCAHQGTEAYLLDSPSPQFGGSGACFDWSLAARFPYRSVLAGGLDESNVAEAIRVARPWGVDACSRLEERPGRKDKERVRAFVHAAFREALAQTPGERTK